MVYLLAATGLMLALFFVSYAVNKMSVYTGFWFVMFLFFGLASFAWAAVDSQNGVLMMLLVGLFAAFLLILLFGVYFLIFYLLLNARNVFKKEKRTLSNSLTLILALGLIVFWVASIIIGRAALPGWVTAIWSGIVFLGAFYLFHVTVFLVSLLLCNLAKPRKNQDYIIVLGSGLVDGKAPPLLGGRIDRAIGFARRQLAAAGRLPKLVMSGGKGADEPVSEAAAMRLYAIDAGFPEDHILIEDRSTNTRENMEFSKSVIRADAGEKRARCIFATSRYHLLRAGIYARRAGLKIDGIGAKTARYFVPNAVVREYIAFLSMHKARFLVVAALVFLLGVVISQLPELLNWLMGAL